MVEEVRSRKYMIGEKKITGGKRTEERIAGEIRKKECEKKRKEQGTIV